MLRDPDTNERICEVCEKPFENKQARWDTKTCGSKCRQQAYRNRNTAKLEKYYEKRRAERQANHDRRERYNANRKKARAKKRRAGSGV